MNTPVDVATTDTADFAASRIAPGSKILEVGCGPGHVGLELAARGFDITGIEADEESAGLARRSGLNVVLTDWLGYKDEAVDAVVFTRSLHHMHSLDAALLHARELLRPGGALLIEDFAFELTDAGTIRWFTSAVRSLQNSLELDLSRDHFLATILAADDPVAKWHDRHDHDLHGYAAMAHAISGLFTISFLESLPYLYRYLVPVLPESAEGAAIITDFKRDEARRGDSGEITLIGRRIAC
jgi:SAM-dependent methyltransferase